VSRQPTTPADIRLLVLDVDGVLTDGRLWFGPDGETHKAFHVRDGLGIKLALAAGIRIAVLSGRRHPAVEARMRELGVTDVRQGVADKVGEFTALLATTAIPPAAAACLVDDTSDLPLARSTGLAAAVADAHPQVLAAVDLVTRLPGGHGAVREFCDLLIAARGARA
jgi:3-deoxy-D-manno-octulosonate 8-phosphate phosphatase (KDO 8-P phosphatase)